MCLIILNSSRIKNKYYPTLRSVVWRCSSPEDFNLKTRNKIYTGFSDFIIVTFTNQLNVRAWRRLGALWRRFGLLWQHKNTSKHQFWPDINDYLKISVNFYLSRGKSIPKRKENHGQNENAGNCNEG
jgi:hypothetical protein